MGIEKTPAELIVFWFRTSGSKQAFIRWAAVIPGAISIFLLFKITLLIGLSLVVRSGDVILVTWAANLLDAGLVPFLIVRYGTPIAPYFRRHTSVALAVVAIFFVVFPRLALELSHAHNPDWHYFWLAVSAVLCGASAVFAVRGINRRESARDHVLLEPNDF